MHTAAGPLKERLTLVPSTQGGPFIFDMGIDLIQQSLFNWTVTITCQSHGNSRHTVVRPQHAQWDADQSTEGYEVEKEV